MNKIGLTTASDMWDRNDTALREQGETYLNRVILCPDSGFTKNHRLLSIILHDETRKPKQSPTRGYKQKKGGGEVEGEQRSNTQEEEA